MPKRKDPDAPKRPRGRPKQEPKLKRSPPLTPVLAPGGARMGRPPKEFNWKQIDKMCELHCTHAEIAHMLETTIETLQDAAMRDWGVSFTVYWERKSAGGKMSLRRAQIQFALKGNPQLLVWMGKQHLGQTEKSVPEDQDPASVAHRIAEAVRQMKNTIGGDPSGSSEDAQ